MQPHVKFPTVSGIGVTCPGFYDEQWRPVTRFQSCLPDLDKALFAMKAVEPFGKIEAIEMENAVLPPRNSAARGTCSRRSATRSAIRRRERFDSHFAENVDRMIDITFRRLCLAPPDRIVRPGE